MLKKVLYRRVALFALILAASAQNSGSTPLSARQIELADQSSRLVAQESNTRPVTRSTVDRLINDLVIFTHPEVPPAERSAPESLLPKIGEWLSLNFDLGAISVLPRVEFASPERIAALRYGHLLSDPEVGLIHGSIAYAPSSPFAMYYDPTRKTISLSELWTGGSPKELSVLVRGVVHHYQNEAQLFYPCPEARDELAFAAQDKWLGLFGHNLREDFAIDDATFLLSTQCVP